MLPAASVINEDLPKGPLVDARPKARRESLADL
jgi:hypothetical protein